MKDKKNGYIYYDSHKKTEKEILRNVAWTSLFHWVYAMVAIFIIVFIVVGFFFRVFSVDGESMKPTFNDNDLLLVSIYDTESVQSGDIVVADLSDNEEIIIVKRVVATENQTVEIDYKTQTLTVDGVVVEEDYISEMSYAPLNEISYPYTVPEGHVFLMGDNRIDSRDSRNKNVKAVPVEKIRGKVAARLYPFSDAVFFGW